MVPLRRIRIGIDVGGTFTHAVALDTANFQLLATTKVPTTHTDSRGVSAGIVQSLHKLLDIGSIAPAEVVMIAHSTTQATNALLEGDVAPVGVIGLAHGLGKGRARKQTNLGNIELAPGRYLRTFHRFLDTATGLSPDQIARAVTELQSEGAQVVAVSGAFSVDDPTYENLVGDYCRQHGIPVTLGSEISQLYGIRARTRTAVINASMLPRMLETANMTEAGVRESGITSPLMIMRSDGGIMDIDQMRHRPILTMLSGPAAGVAAAMMYAGITDGIFLEVGGTSTDISAIRNGKSLVKSAVVGGHRLYLRTLDVRTLGVAGGSVPRVSGHHITHAGPRSAHIADVHYSVFTDGLSADNITVEAFEPKPGDPPDYIRMMAPGHNAFSVTPSCASNLLGLVPEGAASAGNADSARAAFAALARHLHQTDPTAVAEELLDVGTRQVVQTVNDMIEDYELDPQLLTLSGGGGGAAAIVPYTARRMGLPYQIAENAAVISAIGAALALVRDTIEKTIISPTEADILKMRAEAEAAVVRMGASPDSVEVQIEIDAQKNIVRATAQGTTELRTRDLGNTTLDEGEIETRVRQSIRGEIVNLQRLVAIGPLAIFQATTRHGYLGGLIRRSRTELRVIDTEGVIRLQLRNGISHVSNRSQVLATLKDFFDTHTTYGDAGREHPDLFVIFRGRILDMSGLINIDQILSLLQVDLASVPEDEPVAVLLKKL